jgi:cellulose synthase/poly-beta-1,6-N-acetylglucosamine synthase-like glycosyltransferase
LTQVLTLLAIAFIVYAYFLFPALVVLRSVVARRPWKMGTDTPNVDVVIICYNEASCIEAKLQNLVGLDYPADRLRFILASDGSDDDTASVIQRFPDNRITLLDYPRRGKIPALNDAVRTATGEVLVFSDANSMFDRDALRNLVRHFADPAVGCVAGNQVYTKSNSHGAAAAGEHSYWNLDRMIKDAESRSGNAISATGAIYAIRRELVSEVPSGVTDDFTISTRVIRQGYRIVFDPSAIAREAVAGKSKTEFRRKLRVMTRGFQSVWGVRDLLNPFRYGFYSLQLLSHKILRRLVVYPLILLVALIPWQWMEGGWLRWLAIGQLAFYALAFLGMLMAQRGLRLPKVVAMPYYFCLINLAALLASWNFLFGRKIERWDSTRMDSSPACESVQMPRPAS